MHRRWSVLVKRPIAIGSGLDAIGWWRMMWKLNDAEDGEAERSQPSDLVLEEWMAMRQCGNLHQVDQEKPRGIPHDIFPLSRVGWFVDAKIGLSLG